jgi:uncharacterized protein YbaR (Trm112 family)
VHAGCGPGAGASRQALDALKLPARISDFLHMARDLNCPICNADLLLSGDEQPGEEVYCTYCGAPCRIRQGASPEAFDVEEDF